MARGPFQGTFQPNARPTVVTGPDCLVMINQSTQIIGCPTCSKTFDINKYITSIQVDLSIDSVPGSASLNLSVPRHSIDDFFFDGDPVIQPMMEINIYAKGYYLVEGLPQYYPIFWGLVTEVNDSYSGGEHTVSIHCADILKWWELCRMNINPAYTGPVPSKFKQTLNGNVFAGMNPFDMIWSLAQQAFGDIVVGSGSLVSTVRDAPGQNTVFSGALSDLMAYWTSRFGLVASNLMMYGSTGVCVRGDVLQDQFQKNISASATIRKASGGPETAQLLYDPTDPNVVAARTNNTNLGVNFWQSEFQTKLELANAAKEAIGYEFYMDVTGDIVFKPPFYNLDIISNKPVSWIQDIDIIDWDLSESESEVVTQLTLGGNYSGNVDWGWSAEMTPFSTVTDYHLLRQYGWRPQQVNSEFMGGGGDTLSMFYYGLDMLDRINSRRHRGTVTIPMRPELRLGFPIYLAPKDQIWYVSGISHNYAAGGRATTQVTLTAKREKFKAPKGTGTIALTSYTQTAVKAADNTVTPPAQPNPGGVSFPFTGRMLSDGGSFTLDASNAVTLPPTPADLAANPANSLYDPLILRNPQTGRIVGYPNAVMVYIRPYAPSIKDWLAAAGDNPNQANNEKANKNLKKIIGIQLANQQDTLTVNALSNLQEKHLQNRSWFGLTSAGSFMYAHDLGYVPGGVPSASWAQGVIGELVLLPSENLTPKNALTPPGTKILIRPISDSRGFEVIGHYRYGRGLSLSDGQLIDNGQQKTFQAANVSIQVALSGDLYASLTAQAQGLTQVSGTFFNPTATLANLQPTDLQTAGFTSPGQAAPQYSNAGTNFITTATLGSPQQTGVFPSVEASQLSQGLTLAEMTVLDPQGSNDGLSSTQPQCMCLLGRADLAFINTGYQTATLPKTTPDMSTLPNPNAPGGVTSPSKTPGVLAGANLGGPVQGSLYNLPPDQVTSVIDNYLFGLYQALDGPHQTYEQQLRGGIYQAPQPGADGVISVGPTSALGDLAPPFNPASQNVTGNPAAAAQMASSATTGLSQAWNTFGQNLQLSSQIAALSTQISNNQGNLTVLQGQLASLESQTGSTFVGTPSLPQQIAALQSQITALTQKISNESTQLGQLRTQQAQQPTPTSLQGG